ncbi:helix-turn-helix domain-containing protein [Alteromonas sp. AMM-1]|uniref:helix-turn-helix domain-containing protein n=1 Tax=Alteromonas sp. AMM-1 TaxID=3394233 RepID=UPI0039A7750E
MSHTDLHPADNDWHPADIIAAIRKQELTLTELAIQNGLPNRACQTAIRKPHKKAEEVIASQLGLHPMQIWPSRYHSNGKRKRFLHSQMVAEKHDVYTQTCAFSKPKETQKCLSSMSNK